MPDVKVRKIPLPEVAEQRRLQAHVVKQSELLEYLDLFNKLATLNEQLRTLRNEFDPLEALITEVATGRGCDDLKSLKPEDVAALVKQRLEQKEFSVEPGQLDFQIEASQPNGRQTVEWKNVVIELMGPAFATRLQKEAQPKFSYGIRPVVKEVSKAA